jgi:hypothetical protein
MDSRARWSFFQVRMSHTDEEKAADGSYYIVDTYQDPMGTVVKGRFKSLDDANKRLEKIKKLKEYAFQVRLRKT